MISRLNGGRKGSWRSSSSGNGKIGRKQGQQQQQRRRRTRRSSAMLLIVASFFAGVYLYLYLNDLYFYSIDYNNMDNIESLSSSSSSSSSSSEFKDKDKVSESSSSSSSSSNQLKSEIGTSGGESISGSSSSGGTDSDIQLHVANSISSAVYSIGADVPKKKTRKYVRISRDEKNHGDGGPRRPRRRRPAREDRGDGGGNGDGDPRRRRQPARDDGFTAALRQYRLRHMSNRMHNNNNNNNNTDKDISSNNNNNNMILFVHFHKAGGTSMIQKFESEGGYQFWVPNANGNPNGPWDTTAEMENNYLILNNIKENQNNPLQQQQQQQTDDCQLQQRMRRQQRPGGLLRFWDYSRLQFEKFLQHGRRQSQSCLLQKLKLMDMDNERDIDDAHELSDVNNNNNNNNNNTRNHKNTKKGRRQAEEGSPAIAEEENWNNSSGVEFIAMEWNFFVQEHFFEQKQQQQQQQSRIGGNGYLPRQAKIDIVTIIRDPYERFISNFYFEFDNPKKQFTDPMKWAHHDLIRKKGRYTSYIKLPDDDRNPVTGQKITRVSRQHPHVYQYGELVSNAGYYHHVNYNKPNYYTAFLNGLAENNDEGEGKHVGGGGDKNSSRNNNNNYDFDYFAFGLNRTHLETAKQRLHDMFDAILILERPETHHQLNKWFSFLNNTDAANELPHRNGGRSRHPDLKFTREEFYRYNALDKELYEYAVELSLSRLGNEQKQ